MPTTACTHHIPTHAQRMSTHTRSRAPGMGRWESAGRAAQVSGEWRAAGEWKKGLGAGQQFDIKRRWTLIYAD